MLAFFLVCNIINYFFFSLFVLTARFLSACGSYRAVPFFSRGAMFVAVCRL